MMKSRHILLIAGILLLLASWLGPFGFHTLRPRLTAAEYTAYESAVQYQFWQSLGLLGIGVLARTYDSLGLKIAASLLFAGVILFAGSVYAVTFGAPRSLSVAPVGGISIMLGWLVFVITLWRQRD